MASNSTDQAYNSEFLGPRSGAANPGGTTTPTPTPPPEEPTSTGAPATPPGAPAAPASGLGIPVLGELGTGTPIDGLAGGVLGTGGLGLVEGAVGGVGETVNGAGGLGSIGGLGALGGIGGSNNGESSASISAGQPGSGSPLVNSGILTSAPTDNSPLSLAAGNGAGVGNIVDAHALDGSNGSVISGEAFAAGGNPLAIAGVLGESTTSSPVGVDVGGAGQNVADASLLGGSSAIAPLTNALGGDSNDSVISTDAGASNGSPIAMAGLLSDPTSNGQISADALPGANAVNAMLTGSGDSLSFPNLGGVGADSLQGTVASLPVINDAGSIAGGNGEAGQSLIDLSTDGQLVQLNDDHSSLASLNHAVVV